MSARDNLRARLAGKPVPASKPLPTAAALPPCPYLGGPTGEKVKCPTCSGSVELKVLACAKHGKCTPTRKANALACCVGCSDRPVQVAGIIVPQPPAIDLKPVRSKAVVTVVVGRDAKACHAAGGDLLRAYAKRVGADLVVLDWPGHPAWPISSKFVLARVLDHYERIAYLDADTLVRPEAVNLFDMCGEGEFGFVDELQFQRSTPGFNREKDYQRFRVRMGFKSVAALPWYMNSGVMVVPRTHQELLLPPTSPIVPEHCAEQDWIGASLLDSGMKYRLLDRRANWQNWTDPGFRAAPPDAILHWSGAGVDRVNRAEQMKAFAAKG